jgi:glucose/arabinose dehydrogenase
MRKKFLLPLFAFFLFLNATAQQTVVLTLVADGLSSPVAMDCPKDGSKRLFICEQTGKIKIVKAGKVLPLPFLNISSKLDNVKNKIYSEKGLLGIAFHPKFKSNGRFFVYYSAPSKNKDSDHKSILAEYTVSSNPDVADPASEKIIMETEEPESNHNGGQLVFGPDGYLYIGLGDGGGAGDDHGINGNGQNLGTFLGKILRIDVDSKKPYVIPANNPFVNNTNAKPEIWAYGLRNPWRFSFDRKTGRLFCADVGQNQWEEIDIIEGGKNYGWRLKEGNHCYRPASNCDSDGLTPPISEYDHGLGVSITGGFVYRGKSIPTLQGKYIFGDWKGKIFYLEESGGKWLRQDLLPEGKKTNDAGVNINSFGEDEAGEIYLLGQKQMGTLLPNGVVYMLSAK